MEVTAGGAARSLTAGPAGGPTEATAGAVRGGLPIGVGSDGPQTGAAAGLDAAQGWSTFLACFPPAPCASEGGACCGIACSSLTRLSVQASAAASAANMRALSLVAADLHLQSLMLLPTCVETSTHKHCHHNHPHNLLAM